MYMYMYIFVYVYIRIWWGHLLWQRLLARSFRFFCFRNKNQGPSSPTWYPNPYWAFGWSWILDSRTSVCVSQASIWILFHVIPESEGKRLGFSPFFRVRPWVSNWKTMAFPLRDRGFPIENHGFPIEKPWVSHWRTMGFPLKTSIPQADAKGNSARCSFALKCCIRALEFYDEFFGIPYPLPKMDWNGQMLKFVGCNMGM